MKREWIKKRLEDGNRQMMNLVNRKGGIDNLSDADIDRLCRKYGYREPSADEKAYLEWKEAYEVYEEACKLLHDANRFDGDFFGTLSRGEGDAEIDLSMLRGKVLELAPAAKAWAKFLGEVVFRNYLSICEEVGA